MLSSLFNLILLWFFSSSTCICTCIRRFVEINELYYRITDHDSRIFKHRTVNDDGNIKVGPSIILGTLWFVDRMYFDHDIPKIWVVWSKSGCWSNFSWGTICYFRKYWRSSKCIKLYIPIDVEFYDNFKDV